MFRTRLVHRLIAVAATVAAALVVSPVPAAHASAVGVIWNYASYWCADLPDAGPTLNSYVYEHPSCNPTSNDNQAWAIDYTGDLYSEGLPAFTIRNVKSGQCMDLPGTDAVARGTRVWMHDCDRTFNDNQQWVYQPYDAYPGFGLVMNVKTLLDPSPTLCLDVDGWGGQQTGLPLTVYTCTGYGWANNGTDDHLWSIPR
ncbi:RICIN domain-containing protein [Kitasatospora purpeofusca]|uniref:RICIN domain-containing protein n=1 Tax=Kitasatospora purpeofusca TaxID=67352 RepID=UPI0036685B76